MAWNNFLKNLFNGDENEVAVSPDNNSGSQSARYENLSGRAFKKQLAETANAVLMDVRTYGEFSNGTIPGSRNVDFLSSGFSQKVGQLDKNATYFLFCRSGSRSAQACKTMHQQGFDVRNLSGGISEFPS